MIAKHCCYGTCRSGNRYPENSGDVIFIQFVKPKRNLCILNRCLAWTNACGRPHKQLSNIDKITKDTYICSNVSLPVDKYDKMKQLNQMVSINIKP